MAGFAATIFLGAFLLFQVQPILGKILVPTFGGGAGVWTACLLFFQLGLLLGYVYAHLLSSKLSSRRQGLVHAGMLVLSVLGLGLTAPAHSWQPGTSEAPAVAILMKLVVHVGLPYLMLSATGPLLQHWFARTYRGLSPYRLYALSNIASLSALLSFPFVVETKVSRTAQVSIWSIGYLLFVASCATIAWNHAQRSRSSEPVQTPEGGAGARERPSLAQLVFWTVMAALGSVALIATTNQQSQDLAATPLLWVVPLAIYLSTFILCFDGDRWYDRRVFVPLAVTGLLSATFMHVESHSLTTQVVVFASTLFAMCMLCHGELARSKPGPVHLTTFYVAVAVGGALGGVFTALIAPVLFVDYWEYPLSLVAIVLVTLVRIGRQHRPSATPAWRVAWAGACLATLAATVFTGVEIRASASFAEIGRNFYGVQRVQRGVDSEGRMYVELVHGRIRHGTQFTGRGLRNWPTSYFGHESGVGVAVSALRRLRSPKKLRIGVIGLGAGTIAALAGPGDTVRFYEIDPYVEELARKHFTYLADTRAKVEVVHGDARIMLERELDSPQQFDLLVVDAFNSDSIPAHLLTREALAIYELHLRVETGVIAFHISNRYLDLERVVYGLAKASGCEFRLVASAAERQRAGTRYAKWAYVTRYHRFLADERVRLAVDRDVPEHPLVWSDDFTSVLSALASGTQRKHRWRDAPNQGCFVFDNGQLLDLEDESRILWAARKLYADTGSTLMVGSIKEDAARRGNGSLEGPARTVFEHLGLSSEWSRAVLLLMARVDGKTLLNVQCSPGWPGRMQPDAWARLREALTAAGTEASLSAKVARGAEELMALMRRRARFARPPR